VIRAGVSGSSVVVAVADLLTTEFGQEIVILSLRDGVYYSVEDTGARIWQLLQQPISVQEVCDTIASEYDVEAAVCDEDVRALIGTLASRGLIEVREEA
jgi:Coenzyme PQQ synthesis protein D (PqqD)